MSSVLEKRWPREIVVEHGDGTVSLFQDVDQVDWSQVRGRRAGDVFRGNVGRPVHTGMAPIDVGQFVAGMMGFGS